MNRKTIIGISAALTCAFGVTTLAWRAHAAESKDDEIIKSVMKTYHKAPKGVDPVCKKAQDGTATEKEIKDLVAAYKKLTTTKPPQGDEAKWKKMTATLLAAAEGLEKHQPDAVAKYKEAVNCKACHSVFKPE